MSYQNVMRNAVTATAFARYVGIDYSGAEAPTASLKGLRVYLAQGDAPAEEVHPPPSPRKYWTRRGVAQWLLERLSEDMPTLVGIDHGFSFPLLYFEKHHLAPDWSAFLDDFRQHWPTDEDHVYVDRVRAGQFGNGAARAGNARWRRMTEEYAGAAKSVFHFDVTGSVAKSTHAGIPWLRYLRRQLGERIHFWPFDGWAVPPGKSAVVEVYPALWKRDYEPQYRSADQHDAYTIASWLRDADRDGRLQASFHPALTASERTVASVEGWILGVQRGARQSRGEGPAKRPLRPAKARTALLSDSFALAARWHATQVRKATAIPYISHLMSVAALVMEFGGDEQQAIAGLLHDAVEDADSSEEAQRRLAVIRKRFGVRVAAIVAGCTDAIPDAAGHRPDWRRRKEAYLDHLAQADADTLLVAAADKLHNARAILADLRVVGEAVFCRFTAGREGTLWYYGRLADVFQAMLPGTLADELARTVAEFDAHQGTPCAIR